jgi:hypothetical protein
MQRHMKKYIIEKGSHYCKGWRFATSPTDLRFRFFFDPSCLYDETEIIPGWNKLYGWSSLSNHSNSVRIGWQCRAGLIMTGYYCYVGGTRVDGDLTEVLPGKWYEALCKYDNGDFIVSVGTSAKTIPGARKPAIAFRGNPYFGGQSEAPHQMEIWIEEF